MFEHDDFEMDMPGYFVEDNEMPPRPGMGPHPGMNGGMPPRFGHEMHRGAPDMPPPPPHGMDFGPGMPPPPHGMGHRCGPGMPPPPFGMGHHSMPPRGPRPMYREGEEDELPFSRELEKEDELTRLLRACAHHMTHRGGSASRQTQILRLLYEYETLSQRELLDICRVQAGTLSELTAKLESRGLITRERGEKDRRVMMLRLTEDGLKLAETLSSKDENDLFTALSDEERETLKGLLKKLVESWTE